jgi:ABC-2 type transport system permease protein
VSAVRVFRHGMSVGFCDLRVFWDTPKMWLLTWIVRVVTMASMWVLIGRLLDSPELVYFLLVGQAVFAGPQATGWVVASSVWDRFDGTYPHLVISPMSLVPSLMGRSSIWPLNGVATSLVCFCVLIPLFGMQVPWTALLTVPLLMVVICASAFGFYLFLGAWVVHRPQLRNITHNAASVILVAICGAVVPLTFWPGPVQTLAQVLPVTHGLAAMRAALDGSFALAHAGTVLLEVLVGACWLVLAVLVIDRMADRGRRDGSIELTGG